MNYFLQAVNVCLTVRNWLIGYYITEYELKGADRAAYGEALLETLVVHLAKTGLKRMDPRELRRFRQFYMTYPQIRESLTPTLELLPFSRRIAFQEIWEQ